MGPTSKDEVKAPSMPPSKSKAKEKQKACSPVKNQEAEAPGSKEKAEALTQEKEGKSNNKAAKVKKQVMAPNLDSFIIYISYLILFNFRVFLTAVINFNFIIKSGDLFVFE